MKKNRKLGSVQKRRVNQGIQILNNYTADPDCLFQLVATVGPSFFALIIESNTNAVWSRIENPKSFKYEEIKKISQSFKISIINFLEIIERQAAFNLKERIQRRPIGQKRYYPHKYEVEPERKFS